MHQNSEIAGCLATLQEYHTAVSVIEWLRSNGDLRYENGDPITLCAEEMAESFVGTLIMQRAREMLYRLYP